MLNSCVMHRQTGPAPGIMVWGGIEYHSRTPLVRVAAALNSQRYISEVLEPVVLPYLQGLATAIVQQNNARPHVHGLSKGSSSITRLNCFLGRLALRIYHR
ncbi:transposable element Tcb1 transposase [Trichonephila clavipes]|uniref:Transposable element Tcb1 transposase n=1 Tax=Trichonephila clavipes TaxID=2585209 RepID=A0A8X6W8L0_TRICX|nr:transposable element Tcb1 transposase [Trichonephila clavipes]